MSSPHAQIIEKLKAGAAYGVAAAFMRPVTANDQDGYTWRLLVSDGESSGEVDATLSGSAKAELGKEVDEDMLCAAVEKHAGGHPLETRLADLLDEGTITLTVHSF